MEPAAAAGKTSDAMFEVPFQSVNLQALPEMLADFFMCWMLFGTPALLLMLGTGWLLRRFKVHRFRIMRHLRFWEAALVLLVLAFLFGAATGTYEAWTYHRDLFHDHGGWYDFFLAVPGVPGDAMANVYGGDWQDDEAWDYRSDIAILDGLFWASIMTPGVFVMRFGFRRLGVTAPAATPDMGRQPELAGV
jgi:hypothetical protein